MGVCPFSFGGFLQTIFGFAGVILHRKTPRYGDYNIFSRHQTRRTRCVNAKFVALPQIQQASLYISQPRTPR